MTRQLFAMLTGISLFLAASQSLATTPRQEKGLPKTREITILEAEKLIVEERESAGISPELMRHYGFDGDVTHDRHFYFITGILGIEGAEGVDIYAVDRKTGDIWWASACAEETTPKFEAIKRTLRRRIGMTPAAYRRTRIDGPQCDDHFPEARSARKARTGARP